MLILQTQKLANENFDIEVEVYDTSPNSWNVAIRVERLSDTYQFKSKYLRIRSELKTSFDPKNDIWSIGEYSNGIYFSGYPRKRIRRLLNSLMEAHLRVLTEKNSLYNKRLRQIFP